MNSTLKDLLAGTHELPALPQTTARLLELLEDPTVEAVRLLEVIERDPALTANLLKLCNSAYYGRKREVGSVLEALVMLGNRTVVTLAFATSMGKVLRGDLLGYGLAKDDFWRHSLAVAFTAATIVSDAGLVALRDRAFTAGLVHDVGKLVLNRLLAQRLEWEAAPPCREEHLEIERQVAGHDHAAVGAALADGWRFPEMLVAAIRHHHAPATAEAHADLVKVVHAADGLSAALGYGGVGATAPREEPFEESESLGVPLEVARHVAAVLPGQVEQLANLAGTPAESRLSSPSGRW